MSKQSRREGLSRRRFLGLAAGAAAFPYIVPGTALGKNGAAAPSNRITLGFIGIGKMAKGHLGSFLGDDRCQVLAICDVERTRREQQAALANNYYAKRREEASYKSCTDYLDFRELCARDDIDAVVVATPNHWHAQCTIEAARTGKDIYCEKPLARSVVESRAMVDAVRRHGRVLQVGSQQRSDSAFRHACELVRNGRIGTVHTVYVNVGGPPEEDNLPAEEAPEGLDWDFWLGSCPRRPYSSVLAPPESFGGWPQWRYYRPYAGSSMTDFGAHHFDIAQWGLGMDHTGPIEVNHPNDSAYEKLTFVYANGVKMIHGGGYPQAAVEFVGSDGWVRVNRGQYLETEPAHLRHAAFAPHETRLYHSDNHKDNWIEGIQNRRDPICTVEIGHRTASVCHIGNIAYRLGRSLKWDPDREIFPDDPEANRLLEFPMREPWQLS